VDDLEDQAPDVDLVERVRSGDRDAAVVLWTRHYPSVLLAARRVTRQERDAEEIASDAFSGMLSALSTGAGPTTSVRAYLMTSVRNLAASRARRPSSGDVITDDVAVFDRATPDTTVHMSELELVRVAFADLPQRWQVVLWRTAVDRDSNIEVGRAMGLSPNGVAALAKRARRGFRLSYLRAHLSDRGVTAECRPFIDGLADLSISEVGASPQLVEHVSTCELCTLRVEELRAVNLNFAGFLGPAVLGLLPSPMLAGAVAGAGFSGAAAPGPDAATSAIRPGVGRWALGSAAVAGTAVAILLGSRPHVTAPPDVADTHTTTTAPVVAAPTATAPATVTSPGVTPPPTTSPTTQLPVPRRSPQPQQVPPSRRPVATPRVTSPPTTTAPRMSPMSVDLAIAGTRADTAFDVAAAAEGIKGPLGLTIRVPDGVSLSGATGDWGSCSQDTGVITCSLSNAAAGRWAGTIHTRWADTAKGLVRATVTGTYANGSAATGAVGTTWPP
jgi:RNA polymerase sigma factor (sigma-70 family)